MIAKLLTIEEIRRAWEVSRARMTLDCMKAGDNDKAMAAACTRERNRTERLLEQLMALKATSEDDAYELVILARLLLKDDFPDSERIAGILHMASNALCRRIRSAASAEARAA